MYLQSHRSHKAIALNDLARYVKNIWLCQIYTLVNRQKCIFMGIFRFDSLVYLVMVFHVEFSYLCYSLGYLLIYPPQIATIMKLISFCSKYNPVSHTKSLGESQEWKMVFQGNIWSRVKAFNKIHGFAHFGYRRYILHLIIINRAHNLGNL